MNSSDSVQAKNAVWIDMLIMLLGSVIYSLGIYVFTAPNNIAPGGVTGIATMVNFITGGFPIGIGIYLINIPLLVAGYKFISKRFCIKTLFVLTVATILLDFVFPLFMTVYTGQKILAAAFGGVLMGIGTGILYLRGGTTGGTDIGAKLFMKKYPYLKFGTVMLGIEVVVISAAGFVYGDIEACLYALIASFAYTAIIDRILYGGDKGKLVLIISKQNDEIAKVILSKISRGVTLLDGKGAYSGEEKNVVMCAIRNPEYYNLKRMVYEIDPSAFIIVAESSEVLGFGFKPINQEK